MDFANLNNKLKTKFIQDINSNKNADNNDNANNNNNKNNNNYKKKTSINI